MAVVKISTDLDSATYDVFVIYPLCKKRMSFIDVLSEHPGPYELFGHITVPEDVDPVDVKMVLISYARGDNKPVVIRTTTGAGGVYSFPNLRSDQIYYPIALPPIGLPPAVHGPYPSE